MIEKHFKILRTELASAGNPKKSPDMQRYMKSQMPFHGVQTPVRVAICKEVFADVEFKNFNEWQRAVTYVWQNAKYREEKYAALYLCSCKQAREFQVPEALEFYAQLAIDGAWWDFVDGIAGFVGDILKQHPARTKPIMRQWSKHKIFWVRRLAILSQLSFKKETDLKLLYDCITPSLGSDEFFLQKAIGWALRQYAWTDSKEISRYVRLNKEKLAPLSKREALKNVMKGKC